MNGQIDLALLQKSDGRTLKDLKTSIPPRGKLGWIELGRGLAALVVVISHGSYAGVPERFWQYIVPLGSAAVAFFFVLSGFIILYVHQEDIGNPARSPNYLWRRLVRIFPTYWLVFLADLGLHLLVNNRTEMPELNMMPLLHEMLLLPGGKLYIFVAWTLRHELLFYGLFLILILNVRVGLLLFTCWFACILYFFIREGWADDLSRPPLQTITSPMNLCFFIGLAIAAFCRQNMVRIDIFRAPDFCLWLGAISYPLYLCHFTVYFVLGGFFKRLGVDPTWPWRMASILVASLVVATLISRMYEQPLLKSLRRIGPSRRRQADPY